MFETACSFACFALGLGYQDGPIDTEFIRISEYVKHKMSETLKYLNLFLSSGLRRKFGYPYSYLIAARAKISLSCLRMTCLVSGGVVPIS